MATLLPTAKRLIQEIRHDDIGGLAAELAYRLLLAIFPFFIFLAALGAFAAAAAGIDNPVERIMDAVGDTLPSNAAGVLRDQLEHILGERNPGLLSVGIVAAIWAASGAMNTLMKALNRVYDVRETRPFWRRYLLAVGLTLLSGVFFITAFTVLVVGQFLTQEAADGIGIGSLARFALYWGRFPFVAVLLLIAMAVLFWAAPNVRLPFRWVTPGALMFLVAWIIFTVGFAFYVANFGSYNSTYGTLGGVVVLLVWLYLSSFILLAAAELNTIVLRQVAPEETPAGARQTPDQTERGLATNSRHAESHAQTPTRAGISGAATIALGLAIAGLSAWRATRPRHKNSSGS